MASIPADAVAEVVVTVRLPGGGQLVLPREVTVAELQARFGSHGLVHRGRPWSAAEVADLVPESADTVKRRVRSEPRLRAIAGAFKVENGGAWRFPEDRLPEFLDAWMPPMNGSSPGAATGGRPEATEPRYPSPPASDPSEHGIAELNEWEEEYDGR